METFNIDKWYRLLYKWYFEDGAWMWSKICEHCILILQKLNSVCKADISTKSLIKSDDWLKTKTQRVVVSLFPKQPIGGSQESKFLKSSFYGNVRLY